MLYFANFTQIYILTSLVFFSGVLFASETEIKKRTPNKTPLLDVNARNLDSLSLSCLDFLSKSKDPAAKNIGESFLNSEITQDSVIKTLEFINKIQNEDHEHIKIGKKQADGSPWVYRMSKYWFLSQNFDFYRINADSSDAKVNRVTLPAGKLLVTKYAIFEMEISSQQNKKNNMEIYALPEWVNPNLGQPQHRLRYTKQQIFDGVFRKNGLAAGKANALGYLTKANVELVMLQGTFIGNFEDGSRKIFGVAGTNEFPFEKGLKHSLQKRYIYFKEMDNIYGYGKTIDEKIKIEPGLTFAGDVSQFGLGKLMMMYYEDPVTKVANAKIGILADTGSAFTDNSYHLDFLLGTYKNANNFYKEADKIPMFCEFYLLIKK